MNERLNPYLKKLDQEKRLLQQLSRQQEEIIKRHADYLESKIEPQKAKSHIFYPDYFSIHRHCWLKLEQSPELDSQQYTNEPYTYIKLDEQLHPIKGRIAGKKISESQRTKYLFTGNNTMNFFYGSIDNTQFVESISKLNIFPNDIRFTADQLRPLLFKIESSIGLNRRLVFLSASESAKRPITPDALIYYITGPLIAFVKK